MAPLPVMRELQPLQKSAGSHAGAAQTAWYRLVATLTNPDLIAVVVFCAIGLLVAINVILRFPDFGAMAGQLQQFP